ncbi:MAG TPA: hypothetical protein ENI94_13745 [Gammaproteobacteria bacterium]|nr:hypothetical protein [Gammaproteobacteria bacterium]
MQNGRSVLKRTVPLLLILGLAISGAILLVATRPRTPPPKSEEKIWVVAIQTATPAQHFPAITLYGRIERIHLLLINGGGGLLLVVGILLLFLNRRVASVLPSSPTWKNAWS